MGDRRCARRRQVPADRWGGVLVAAVVLTLSGCARGQADDELVVLAAASLTEPFTAVAEAFEQAHPGTQVVVSFAGSHTLVAHIEQGAPADVVATADARVMDRAARAGLVDDPVTFAGNELVVATPTREPGTITAPADLGEQGLRIALAAPAVPAGRYARQALDELGIAERVEANVVSNEADVRGALGKVVAGEVDAAIVYATDVTSALADEVDTVALPVDVDVRYPIAVAARTERGDLARAFVAFVTDGPGRQLLSDAGFANP